MTYISPELCVACGEPTSLCECKWPEIYDEFSNGASNGIPAMVREIISLRDDLNFEAEYRKNLRSDFNIARNDLSIAIEALEKLSEHNGGCDGTLGCMCNAPIAREALKKIKGEIK